MIYFQIIFGLVLVGGLAYAIRKVEQSIRLKERNDRLMEDLDEQKKEAQKWANSGVTSVPDRLRALAAKKRKDNP